MTITKLFDSIETLFRWAGLDWLDLAEEYAKYLGCDNNDSFIKFSENDLNFLNRFGGIVDLRLMKKFKDKNWFELEQIYDSLP